MKLYNKIEAMERMNALAKAKAPFLFILSYDGESAYVELLDDISPEECLYEFPAKSNVEEFYSTAEGVSELSFERDDEIKWNIHLMSLNEYAVGFNKILNNIRAGNSYLANYTVKVPVDTNLSLKEVMIKSKAMYKLWIRDKFVCFSPEIFVRLDKDTISSYPMKGTIDATLENAEQLLIDDVKEAAEHATIVDLIRNDLSIVSRNVRVSKYRYVEQLTTNKGAILQTSSEIKGQLDEYYKENIGSMLYKLLPAGSITGAPKRKTVDIISEAEIYDRGFYTGVMGVYDGYTLDSAVMIRFLEQSDNGEMFFKAGGGITAMSECEKEYEEVKQKVYVPIY